MSLHRVSSIASYEQIRNASPARSEHTKLSFNPAGSKLMPPGIKDEGIGAFEVSKPRRILQVLIAVIYCLFAAGVVFGYAAIKPVLVKEGVYSEFCPEVHEEEAHHAAGSGTCFEQEIRLNFMFTTAAVATNVCALPVGAVLDRYGPRVCGVIGSLLLAVGSLLLAFAAQASFDAYIPGYLFLALGGPFVFISSFQLSNTFPRHSGLILALLTGAFDSSSAIFLFYRLIYTASDGQFSPHKFFLVYLIVPVFILIVQLTVMPPKSYETAGQLINQAKAVDFSDDDGRADIRGRQERYERRESAVSELTSLLGKGGDKQQEQERKKQQISGVWGALHGRSALQQIKTPWFILVATFTVVQMTRINYFVATIYTQYQYLLGDDHPAEVVNHFFDVALPVGGLCSIPFIGIILDNTSTAFCLGVLVTVATAIGVLGVLPYMWAAYANIILFVLYRPLYYTAVSDYASKVFGFQTFGKVYGLVICLAGLLNFSQSALDAATHKGFKNDPLPVNIILLVIALVVGIALVGYVWYKSRYMHREELEEEAEDAAETPMPGVEVDSD